jgi:hypothetical protein
MRNHDQLFAANVLDRKFDKAANRNREVLANDSNTRAKRREHRVRSEHDRTSRKRSRNNFSNSRSAENRRREQTQHLVQT